MRRFLSNYEHERELLMYTVNDTRCNITRVKSKQNATIFKPKYNMVALQSKNDCEVCYYLSSTSLREVFKIW